MLLRHTPALLLAAFLSLAASTTPSSAALIHDFECDAGGAFACTGNITLAEPMIGEFELFGLDFNAPAFGIMGSPSDIQKDEPFVFDVAPGDPWALIDGSFAAIFGAYQVDFDITGPNALNIQVTGVNTTMRPVRTTATLTPIHDVPEPAILAIFGAGLAVFGFAARRRKALQG